jgi:hypothetical protein
VADAEEVEVVVAHNERATLRVGDVLLKIAADQRRTDARSRRWPWRRSRFRRSCGASRRCSRSPLSRRLHEAAAGAAARMLHDAPLPPWPGPSLEEIASDLDGECEWLVTSGAC